MKKTALTLGIIGCLLSAHLAFAESEENAGFADVPEIKQYYIAIMDLYDRGIVEGYDDGNFRPDDEINRVETLKIILEYFEWTNNDDEISTDALFSDTDPEAWYYPYLHLAYMENFIDGYPDGTFGPDNNVNLAETLKMVSQAAEFKFIEEFTIEIDPAPDVPADVWYAGYAYHALNEGAVYLNTEGNLAADQYVTRGQLADILYRFAYDDQFSGKVYYGNATYYADFFEGRTTASGEIYTQDLPTAAHLTLPFGTMVRVTHRESGDTITVRINDRGPYSDHAIIDLSSSAFDDISHIGAGVIPVEIEIIYPEE